MMPVGLVALVRSGTTDVTGGERKYCIILKVGDGGIAASAS